MWFCWAFSGWAFGGPRGCPGHHFTREHRVLQVGAVPGCRSTAPEHFCLSCVRLLRVGLGRVLLGAVKRTRFPLKVFPSSRNQPDLDPPEGLQWRSRNRVCDRLLTAAHCGLLGHSDVQLLQLGLEVRVQLQAQQSLKDEGLELLWRLDIGLHGLGVPRERGRLFGGRLAGKRVKLFLKTKGAHLCLPTIPRPTPVAGIPALSPGWLLDRLGNDSSGSWPRPEGHRVSRFSYILLFCPHHTLMVWGMPRVTPFYRRKSKAPRARVHHSRRPESSKVPPGRYAPVHARGPVVAGTFFGNRTSTDGMEPLTAGQRSSPESQNADRPRWQWRVAGTGVGGCGELGCVTGTVLFSQGGDRPEVMVAMVTQHRELSWTLNATKRDTYKWFRRWVCHASFNHNF